VGWQGEEQGRGAGEAGQGARAHDPAEKAAADARAEERVREVEASKLGTMQRHAAAVDQPSLPEPPARAVPDVLPGAHLVKARDDDGRVTDAAPNATETGAAATSRARRSSPS
jgi:hypothetical protein